MSENTKIAFSGDEWECLNNTLFFELKHAGTYKIMQYLGDLAILYTENAQSNAPILFNSSVSAKISKGENHHGLPYIVLDYPRIKENVSNFILVRTFIWWGKHISLQIIIAGDYTRYIQIGQDLQDALIGLGEAAIWDTNIHGRNFIPVSEYIRNEHAAEAKIKIAYIWPLDLLNSNDATETLLIAFNKLISTVHLTK